MGKNTAYLEHKKHDLNPLIDGFDIIIYYVMPKQIDNYTQEKVGSAMEQVHDYSRQDLGDGIIRIRYWTVIGSNTHWFGILGLGLPNLGLLVAKGISKLSPPWQQHYFDASSGKKMTKEKAQQKQEQNSKQNKAKAEAEAFKKNLAQQLSHHMGIALTAVKQAETLEKQQAQCPVTGGDQKAEATFKKALRHFQEAQDLIEQLEGDQSAEHLSTMISNSIASLKQKLGSISQNSISVSMVQKKSVAAPDVNGVGKSVIGIVRHQ